MSSTDPPLLYWLIDYSNVAMSPISFKILQSHHTPKNILQKEEIKQKCNLSIEIAKTAISMQLFTSHEINYSSSSQSKN